MGLRGPNGQQTPVSTQPAPSVLPNGSTSYAGLRPAGAAQQTGGQSGAQATSTAAQTGSFTASMMTGQSSASLDSLRQSGGAHAPLVAGSALFATAIALAVGALAGGRILL